MTLNFLGNEYLRVNAFADAEKCWREALALRTSFQLTRNNKDYANLVSNLAGVLGAHTGEHESALALRLESLSAKRLLWGECTVQYADALWEVSRSLCRLKRFVEER